MGTQQAPLRRIQGGSPNSRGFNQRAQRTNRASNPNTVFNQRNGNQGGSNMDLRLQNTINQQRQQQQMGSALNNAQQNYPGQQQGGGGGGGFTNHANRLAGAMPGAGGWGQPGGMNTFGNMMQGRGGGGGGQGGYGRPNPLPEGFAQTMDFREGRDYPYPDGSYDRSPWGNSPLEGGGGGGYSQRAPSNPYQQQDPNLGRYRPPTMNGDGSWNDEGGYNYNLPGAYGGQGYYGYNPGNPFGMGFPGGGMGFPGGNNPYMGMFSGYNPGNPFGMGGLFPGGQQLPQYGGGRRGRGR